MFVFHFQDESLALVAAFLSEMTLTMVTRGHPARIVVTIQSWENKLTAAALMVPPVNE